MHAGSAIDGILEREDCTLTDLLDEDDVLQECKANNRKLIDFLVDQKVMEEMVTLVIKEPDEDADEKSKYKHPNTACNLLTSDVIQIVDKLASETSLLDQLWSFLDTEKRLNSLLASFFSKVMATLLKSKTEMMLEYIRGKLNAIQLFLDHIDTSAIMDLILVLTSCCEAPEQRASLMSWLEQEKLIPRLMGLIDPSVHESKQSNASQTLCEMLRMCRENGLLQPNDTNLPDHLLHMLEDPSLISQLLSNILKSSDSDDALIHGINYILTLLEPRSQVSEDSPLGFTVFIPEKSVPAALNVTSLVEAIVPSLPRLHELLENPSSIDPIEMTIGTLSPPFGNARLQIVRLITALLVTNIPEVYAQLAQLSTLKIVIDLFFHYDLNNFLHLQVEQAVKSVLSSPIAIESNNSVQNTSVFASLFQECRLLQRIVQAGEEDAVTQGQPRTRRKGYMGHLTRIASDLLKEAEVQPRIKAAIEELTEEDSQRWTDFVAGPFAEVRRKNEMDLGGKRPVMSSFDESGEEDDFGGPVSRQMQIQDSSLQQAYTHYQMQQMSSEFVESLGFDDDDFPPSEESATAKFDRIQFFDFSTLADEDNPGAALFEACCQERIRPYGEPDEDEVWEEKELTFAETTQEEIVGMGIERADDMARSESTSSDDQAFLRDEREARNEVDGSFSTRVTITQHEELEEDEMEIEFEMMNWPPKTEKPNSHDQLVDMDTSIPDWAREPVAAQQQAGWADFDNLDVSPFGDAVTVTSTEGQSSSASKYTAEIAEEVMGKVDETDRGNEEVGTDDDSDDSDERSGSYSFITEEEVEEAASSNAINQLPVATNGEPVEAKPELPEIRTELVDVNITVNDLEVDRVTETPMDDGVVSQNTEEINNVEDTLSDKTTTNSRTSTEEESPAQDSSSTSEDTGHAEESTEVPDEDLQQNYVFLSSSGMMKEDRDGSVEDSNMGAHQGKSVGDSQEASRSRDIEKARDEARQAMELYESTTNENDTNENDTE